MVNARTDRLIEHFHVALPTPASNELSDAHLLERYLANRDTDSFAAIIQRFGPMVWGVCRRQLAQHQDCEDAFQATFLVLVRKATGVSPRQMLGNWLHGVARQTALKARALAARRSNRECQVTHIPERETISPESRQDIRAVLDEELLRLPQCYRAVVLLCDLEGKTRMEAARQLGIPSGTVAGWLARARVLLAKRLTRRGVTFSVASLATPLVESEASAKPLPSVVSATINTASKCIAGSSTAGVGRLSVNTLTEGVLHSMFLSKLKAALALVLLAGIIGTGITGIAIHATAGDEPKSKSKSPTKSSTSVADAEGAAPDLRDMKKEIDRLRAEVETIKKQLSSATKTGPAPKEDAEPVLVIKVYPVAQLVIEREKNDALVRVITSTVRPASWSNGGGEGTIEYFSAGKSLVINQTESVHLQVEKLLEELLKVKEAQEENRAPKK